MVFGFLSLFVRFAYSNGLGAGFEFTQTLDPISQKSMKAAIFFPTNDLGGPTDIGRISIAATQNAPISPGRHPLILLSHGNGGGMFSHQDMAIFLAKQGYVVVAVEHPGDNYHEDSGSGTDRVLIGRGLQLMAWLDFLLSNPKFSTSIDSSRIGVAGFSAGGYTALITVGAKPNFSSLLLYCQEDPRSPICVGNGRVQLSSPPLVSKADPRVRAAFIMSPPAGYFNQQSLAKISVPIYLYAAANDSVLPIKYNASILKKEIPSIVAYSEVPNADHFVFLSPCSASMKAIAPALCTDPPGVDRQAIHARINHDAVAFFNNHLNVKTGLTRP